MLSHEPLTTITSKKQHVLSVKQFDRESLAALFSIANDLKSLPYKPMPRRKCMASVFFEPSTRTRLSFEMAFQKLGGDILSVENAFDNSSDKKGERFEDTIRTISQYVDFIVMRHPEVGAVERAAAVADCCVINAGDGSGEHPTQALLDLYTVNRRFHSIDGLKFLILGDIGKARTINSLVELLKLYDVSIEMRHMNLYKDDKEPDWKAADVIYMTRMQTERGEQTEPVKLRELPLDKIKEDAIIMHPLPRKEELPVSVDKDPRAYYWRQVKNGLVVRQALFEYLWYYQWN